MSSFPVNAVMIDVMVSYALQRDSSGDTLTYYWDNPERQVKVTVENAGEVALMLYDWNREATWADEPDAPPYYFTQWIGYMEPVKMLRVIHCYEYQSCDPANWERTEAHAFLATLERRVIHALPGYWDHDGHISEAREVFTGEPTKVRHPMRRLI